MFDLPGVFYRIRIPTFKSDGVLCGKNNNTLMNTDPPVGGQVQADLRR